MCVKNDSVFVLITQVNDKKHVRVTIHLLGHFAITGQQKNVSSHTCVTLNKKLYVILA